MIDCPVNISDYEVPLKQKSAEPTQSVVELPKPCDLAAPDPEEVVNTQHIPGAAEVVQIEVKEAVSQLF